MYVQPFSFNCEKCGKRCNSSKSITEYTTEGFLATSDHCPDQQTTRGNEYEHSNEPDDEPIEPSNGKVGPDTPINRDWIPRSKYRRVQNQIKKQHLSVIFNLSSIILTPGMEALLNRGLNFAVLPLKLDITQVLVDWKRFERTMIWREWWFGCETVDNIKEPIFKTKKSNLPKNYKMPNGLRTYISAVRSEIIDPKNRNKVESNLTFEEQQALKDLVKLRREKKHSG